MYFVNRWLLRPHVSGGVAGAFLHGYLTDLLAMPISIPVMIWLLQACKRRGLERPSAFEIFTLLLVFSVLFEVWLPHTTRFGPFAPGDPFDVLAYCTGGALAWLWWKWRYREMTLAADAATPPL